MVGIYKIENKINKMCYIGQSVNIERRLKNHKKEAFNSNSNAYNCPLYQAFRKCGLENFDFSILEECSINDLNKKEEFWIKYFDSCNNGYNQTIGGSGTRPVPSNVIFVIHDLKNTNLTFREIAERNEIGYDMVTKINQGKFWYQETESYPIRNKDKIWETVAISKNRPYKKENFCPICGQKILLKSTYCSKCIPNISSSKPPKEMLEQQLIDYKGNLTQIAKLYNLTDNAIKKWCKSYDLNPNTYRFSLSKEELEKALEETHTIRKTAEILNVAETTVKKYCKKHNIDYQKYLYQKPSKEKVIELLKLTKNLL